MNKKCLEKSACTPIYVFQVRKEDSGKCTRSFHEQCINDLKERSNLYKCPLFRENSIPK